MAAHSGFDSMAEGDLLSFGADWQDGFVGAQPQQADGLSYTVSRCNDGHTGVSILTPEPEGSTQLQDGVPRRLGSDSLSLSQPFVSPLPREVSADDPFQHSASLLADVSQSSGRFSGVSMLADSQGSDLDSWGSFRLPDESLNMMAGDIAERHAGLAQHSHSPLAGIKQSLNPSKLSVRVADSQSIQAAEASPNEVISSKQRMQLDLFLQSSIDTL